MHSKGHTGQANWPTQPESVLYLAQATRILHNQNKQMHTKRGFSVSLKAMADLTTLAGPSAHSPPSFCRLNSFIPELHELFLSGASR